MARKDQLEALNEGLKVAENDMSIPLLRTLIAASLNPHLSVTDIAQVIGVPQQTASRYVAILQGRYQTAESASAFNRGPLLSHKPSANDLRRYELVLTPRGNARLDEILNEIYSKGDAGK